MPINTVTVLLAGVTYIGFIMFAARFLSHKWHPDGGRDELTEQEQYRIRPLLEEAWKDLEGDDESAS